MYLQPPFSYILSNRSVEIGTCQFCMVKLPDGNVFYHTNDLEVSLYQDYDLGKYVFICGLVVDLIGNTIDNKKTVISLYEELLKGETAFFEYIKFLAGRHIIIYNNGCETFIIHDASGTMKVLYDENNRAVSSNLFLIDDLFNHGTRKFRKNFNLKLWNRGTLGNLEPIEGIKILTPNHKLSLSSFVIKRYYPTTFLEPRINIAEVSSEIAELVHRQEELLRAKYRFVHSITSGIDSKFSLALTKRSNISSDIFFTYFFHEANVIDALITNDIAKKMRLNHYILYTKEFKDIVLNLQSNKILHSDDQTFIDSIRKWAWYPSGAKHVCSYKILLDKYKHSGLPLHIRSNLYEVARVRWGEECHDPSQILQKSRKKHWLSDNDAKKIFEEYFIETEINNESVYGFDLLDIFFWEHNSGTWLCEVLQETDFVFNTHSWINCRKIIELLLSVDFQQRKDASVFKHLIRENTPEIMDIPINPRNYNFKVEKGNESMAPGNYRVSCANKKMTIEKQEESSQTTLGGYKRRSVQFFQLGEEDFSPAEPTVYAIDWDGVTYEFLLSRRPESHQAVVLGNGALDRSKHPLPIFQRHSWGKNISCNAIWYFDPTVYRGEATLCWCYGDNTRWYLEDIAYLVKMILSKWGISIENTLFFGSSGGGFTSVMMATLLRGKALVFNPQLFIQNYYPGMVKPFKKAVLLPGEMLIEERINAVSLFLREGYYPSLHIIQNIRAQKDVEEQLTVFLKHLPMLNQDLSFLRIDFYSDAGGHKALLPKNETLQSIYEDLVLPIKMQVSPPNEPAWLLHYKNMLKPLTLSPNAQQIACNFNFTVPNPKSYFGNSEIVRIGADLMNGKLHVLPNINAVPYRLDTFDWGLLPSRSANTFQLYLQGLLPVQYLVRAFAKVGDLAFLEYAWKLLNSWIRYAEQQNSLPKNERNKFVWRDHPAALRAENLFFFGKACLAAGNLDEVRYSQLANLLYQHGEWLDDDNNYKEKHNHGIMEDRVLLYLSYVLDRLEWRVHAKERLLGQLHHAFNDEMVHTENSASYAMMLPPLFLEIGKFLLAQGDPFGEKLCEDAKRAQEFNGWTMKPNGIVAQIGDTGNPPRQLYGKDSAMQRLSPELYRLYPHAGYYFYRSNQDVEYKDDTWKMIKSGYCNTTHKHADDGSFMLYSKGYEIFTDGGFYTYAQDDFRKYFVSANAHNTVVVDEQSYVINKDNIARVGMLFGEHYEDYDHIRVFNDAYEGVHMERDFCSADDLTIVYDSISSDREHCYSQLFHLSEYIEVIEKNKNDILLKIADSGYRVRLRQYGADVTLDIIRGNPKKPGYGLIARGLHHYEVVTTLKFEQKGTSCRFATVITIEDENGNVRIPRGTIHSDQVVWLETYDAFLLNNEVAISCRKTPR